MTGQGGPFVRVVETSGKLGKWGWQAGGVRERRPRVFAAAFGRGIVLILPLLSRFAGAFVAHCFWELSAVCRLGDGDGGLREGRKSLQACLSLRTSLTREVDGHEPEKRART